MGKATQDGRVYMNLRAWPWTRDTLRRCCALQQELNVGCEDWTKRPPNGLAAQVLDQALERHEAFLERACERDRSGMSVSWRKSAENRELRWAQAVSKGHTPHSEPTAPNGPLPQLEGSFDA